MSLSLRLEAKNTKLKEFIETKCVRNALQQCSDWSGDMDML